MNITEVKEESQILLKVQGRIDTNTSREFQDAILNGFQKKTEITVDMEKVDYVSSAGLRAILVGHKTAVSKDGALTLKNLQSPVREVLDMSGFSKFLHIEE